MNNSQNNLQEPTSQEIPAILKSCPPAYMAKSLEQRNPSELSAGSTFHEIQTLESLCKAEWVRYHDPDCKSPAITYRASLPGKLGIAPLTNLDLNEVVFLRPAHKGEIVIKDEESPYKGQQATELVSDLDNLNCDVSFTTLILGPNKENTAWDFWTLFPGSCSFSFPEIGFQSLTELYNVNIDGVIPLTVKEAQELGFYFCKKVTEYS